MLLYILFGCGLCFRCWFGLRCWFGRSRSFTLKLSQQSFHLGEKRHSGLGVALVALLWLGGKFPFRVLFILGLGKLDCGGKGNRIPLFGSCLEFSEDLSFQPQRRPLQRASGFKPS